MSNWYYQIYFNKIFLALRLKVVIFVLYMAKTKKKEIGLHDLIKEEREAQGLSKYRLSKMLDTNPSHYGTMENGKYSPSLDMMKRICAALNVSITIQPDGNTKLTKG